MMRAPGTLDTIFVALADPFGGGDGVVEPGFSGFDDHSGELFSGGFGALFLVVVILIVAGVIFTIVVNARKYRVLKDAGVDPLTVDAQLAAKLLANPALAPVVAVSGADEPAVPYTDLAPRTIEQRLADVDDLHARGVISDDERRAARASILAAS